MSRKILSLFIAIYFCHFYYPFLQQIGTKLKAEKVPQSSNVSKTVLSEEIDSKMAPGLENCSKVDAVDAKWRARRFLENRR